MVEEPVLEDDSPDVLDLPILTDVPGIELPGNDAEVEIFDDLAPIDLSPVSDEEQDAQIIEMRSIDLDDLQADSEQPALETFEEAGTDWFDLGDSSSTIEQDRIDLQSHDSNAEEFDFVATADEIETDLDSLIDMGSESSDMGGIQYGGSDAPSQSIDDGPANNVVPLHPEMDAFAQHVPGADPLGGDTFGQDSLTQDSSAVETPPSPVQDNDALKPTETGWVSLPPSIDPASEADPWAHMRPSEEQPKKGFWSNRPKFFGGDERRRKRRERNDDQHEPIDENTNVSFDKTCPNCGDDCQVDLDDPIGRRMHVSCPACQHIWHTPYILEDSEAS